MTPESAAAAVADRSALYSAPWRERLADGGLSAPYGPPSAAAYAVQVAKHRDWSYRPDHRRSKESVVEGERMVAWLAEHEAELPERERQVARMVYVDGHALRFVARKLGVSRDSARSYLKRLLKRLDNGDSGSAP